MITCSAASTPREEEEAWHRRRAEEELQIAQGSECPVSRRFHYHLAALHLDRAYAGARPEERLRRVA